MSNIPPDIFIAHIIVIFLAIGLHEYAHCKVADMCGDPTPSYYGRVTLNLFKHFEISGVIMMFISAFTGIGLGWGKPAPVNDSKMGNPRWDGFATVAAGPLSNLAQAAMWAILFRLLVQAPVPPFFVVLCMLGVFVNLSIMLFNLIPFGPLDGHWLVGYILPERPRWAWFKFNRAIGFFGLLLVITVLNQIARGGGPDVIDMMIGRPTAWLFQLLTGQALP